MLGTDFLASAAAYTARCLLSEHGYPFVISLFLGLEASSGLIVVVYHKVIGYSHAFGAGQAVGTARTGYCVVGSEYILRLFDDVKAAVIQHADI